MSTGTDATRRWLARRVVQPIAALALCAAVGGLVQAVDHSPATSAPLTTVARSSAARSVLADRTTTLASARRADEARHDLHVLQRRMHYAVSAVDLRTGRRVVIGHDSFRMASLIKIHLATLQDLGRRSPRSQAAMIQVSDNDAADAAYRQLGGGARIQRLLADRLDVRGISVDDDGAWGLSRTTARSVTDLLEVVFDRDHQDLARLRRLMQSVDEEQSGGVSAANDRGSTVALKNGWLPRSDGWIVTSGGRIVVDGDPWVIAVLTDGMPSLKVGLERIGRIAQLAVRASDPPALDALTTAGPTFQPLAAQSSRSTDR